MTEAELIDAVVECAHLFGWKVAHFRPAQTSKGWRTPVSVDGKGFPDLVLAREGDVLFAELKSATGVLTLEQTAWKIALDWGGEETKMHVWRPRDWQDGTIEAALRR